MLHPITFSIPAEKITTSPPVKTKLISDLIPGKLRTYIYKTEEDYYNEYKKSLFATTIKKSGWDCMRHYEILANGCIPYFPNVEKCPANMMALLPKALFLKANALYTKHRGKQLTKLTSAEMDECTALINSLLDYTRTHLTTEHLARYILEKSEKQQVKSILYLSGEVKPDYLRCLTLHGFKKILGARCHDYPKIEHMYTGQYKNLYGKGFSYSSLLEHATHDDTLDKTIEQDIKSHTYDIVIYGSYHRGIPFYELVCEHYKPVDVIFLCGEDDNHGTKVKDDHDIYVQRGHTVFVREMK